MEDSDTEQDQLMFGGRQLHHASGPTGSIGRMRLKTRSKDRLKGLRTDVTETETEREGPARVLPTARGPAHHPPSTTPLASRLIPLVLLSCRLLAVVPATIGTTLHIHNVIHPPQDLDHTRIDFAVAACWGSNVGFLRAAYSYAGALIILFSLLSSGSSRSKQSAGPQPISHYPSLMFLNVRQHVGQ
ncbi:unnamed protein product [Rhizoctonia solani]|uniref:Uncharacterized protein n=1 Tax=Rhizoctonia solani TaxID=456999 RepID=A0A8H2WBZ2_9AGAM|nr:unnamed protein product [Rhizoctonia solani]